MQSENVLVAISSSPWLPCVGSCGEEQHGQCEQVCQFLICWVGRLTDGKTSKPSGTEILLLLSLVPDIGEKVVAAVINSPSALGSFSNLEMQHNGKEC